MTDAFKYDDARGLVGSLTVPFRLVSGPMSEVITTFRYNVPINPKTFRTAQR